MNLQVAKQFVADFVKGDYTPEEYAAFLRWLRGATAGELNEIADEHESMHEHWDAALVPTEEWRSRLEGRLDRVGKAAPVRVIGENWFVRRRSWVAAASVAVVIAGGAYFFAQHKEVKTAAIRQDIPVMAKAAESPVGGENKQVVLPDGSKVLLNVASTLRYPEAFGSTERVVELSGEAYFEVMPDASKPFRVIIKDAELRVLGTNFNIRAYGDEQESRTTLVAGSVEMKAASGEKQLRPGQQAKIAYASTGGSDAIQVSSVDVDNILAWEKGDFKFTDENIHTVMGVISKYFNVETEIDPSAANFKMTGIVSRSAGLEANVSMVKSAGVSAGIKVIRDGKKVKISL
jgi:ferric-dicitrate binding protein FerR (iron transport regulator)